MTGFQAEIVIWSKNITRNNRGEAASILFFVPMILDINQTLGIAVPKIGRMRWTQMNLIPKIAK